MADYLILKQNGSAWSVVNAISNKTANADGEDAAIRESFNGPGTYTALRVDNARIINVTMEPKLTERVVEEPEPGPVEEPVEEPAEEAPEVSDDLVEASEEPVDEGEEPEATP